MTNPTSSTRTTVIVPPEGGTQLHAFGDAPLVKLSGEQTGRSLALALNTTPPGGGPPPHRHLNEDEIFITVEGRLRFFADEKWTDALPVGGVVLLPRGQVHTFQNVGDTPSKAWLLTTPVGFENFFARCRPLFAGEGAPPDTASIIVISTEDGIEYLPPLSGTPPPPPSVPI